MRSLDNVLMFHRRIPGMAIFSGIARVEEGGRPPHVGIRRGGKIGVITAKWGDQRDIMHLAILGAEKWQSALGADNPHHTAAYVIYAYRI